jgi:RNA polymerase sigma-70 factor (ECF subfamily)
MPSIYPLFNGRRLVDPRGDSERSERTWGERIAAGDAAAFDEAVRAYWPKLAAYVARLVGGVEPAKDIVQETFMQVWLRRAELRSDASLKPYLYRIAHNRAADHLRRNRVRTFWQRRQPDASPTVEPVDVDVLLRRERISQAVNAAVQALPPRRRHVFVLAHLHDFSHAEIAEMLGISRQTVSNQVSAALADLRRTLASLYASDGALGPL